MMNQLTGSSSEIPFVEVFLDKKKKAEVSVPYHMQPPSIPPTQPYVFVIKQSKDSNKILKYKSMDDYTMYSVNMNNLSSLSGCFIRDNNMGQMSLGSFFVSIKSLVSDFIYDKHIKLGQWVEICGYMKKQVFEDMNQPQQLIHLITDVFEKKALRDQ